MGLRNRAQSAPVRAIAARTVADMAPSRMRSAAAREAGDAWLADCSAHPASVRTAWRKESLAPIASGTHWLVAEVSLLMDTMHALKRIRVERLGPVLADSERNTAWWLVPAEAAAELADVRQLTVQPEGWLLHCPPASWPVDGRLWLSRPDGSGLLTDPAVLAAALGPGGAYRLPSEEDHDENRHGPVPGPRTPPRRTRSAG